MSEGAFHRVISEHVALAERNKRLEATMPLDRYREQLRRGVADDPAPLARPLENDPVTVTNASLARHWRDPDSWWDASEERPPPEFDGGDD